MRTFIRIAAATGGLAVAMSLAFLPVRASEPMPPVSWRPATVLDLQPFRQATAIRIRPGERDEGAVTLINLNPAINVWYVLSITKAGAPRRDYHLENPAPKTRRVVLDSAYPSGIMLEEATRRVPCELFARIAPDLLERARQTLVMYAPICGGQLYVLRPGVGHRTGLEAATEFVRGRIWSGEAVIGLGHQLLSDANRETGTTHTDAGAAASARVGREGPAPARLAQEGAGLVMVVPGLGIDLPGAADGLLAPGAWYSTGSAGSYVSVVQPGFVETTGRSGDRSLLALDGVERSSLCFLFAFDLTHFDLDYARGTTHPGLGWSEHMRPEMRDSRMPGPDGIDSDAPLVSTGLVPPYERQRVVAAFTAGFKREHGAFRTGDLSRVNHASHYGFIERGVVLSRLQPGLATLLVLDDGTVELKTWEAADNGRLRHIQFARQNGVPIVESDPSTQSPMPGRLVGQWGAGNWSGSQDRKLRTMRSAVAMQSVGGRRYLIYAVFSSATPAAMVRVFQAYGCRYAMMLDMNALEHTYFAFYRPVAPQRSVEYLIRGMQEVDANASTPVRQALRFIDYADNRDFFYVLRHDAASGGTSKGGR